MQSENFRSYEHTRTPKREELVESRERVKLEGRVEGDEDQLSLPSTMQSLGSLDDYSTPEKTPTSSNLGGYIKQKADEFKGKMTEKFGEEIQPEKDLDQEVKEQIKEINEEIKQQPHGEEEIVEGQGQAKAKGKDFLSQKMGEMKGKSGALDLKDISKEILDKALGKIDEMREKAGQQGEQLKQESKTSDQLSFEQKSQLSGQQQESRRPEESHEHHQLSTESPSFKPTEEGHLLIEKVKEGLEEHVPLTEIIEEIDHEKQSQSPQGKGQPALDSLKQGAQEMSGKISDKIEDVKNKFNAPKSEDKGDFKQESSESSEKSQDLEESQPQSQEKPASLSTLKQNVQDVSNKISDKVQDVKDSLNQRKEEKSEDQQESQGEKPKEERVPLVDKILGRIHAVNDNFHQSVEDVRNAFKIEERTDERQPLIDVVTGRINEVTSKISSTIETVKSKVKPSHEEGLPQKKAEIPKKEESSELPQEGGQSLKQKISGGFQNISNLISQNLENVKGRFTSGKEEGEGAEKFHKVDEGFSETVKEYKEEKRLEELGGHEWISENPFQSLSNNQELEKQSLVEKIKGKFRKEANEEDEEIHDVVEQPAEAIKEESQTLKQRISQNVESLKGKFKFGKEKVQEEASEQLSENKFLEQPAESLKKEGQSLKKKADESLEDFSDKLKSGKEEIQEKSLEQPTESLQQESQSLKERISGGFQSISGKISHNVDSLKGKFRSGKEQAQEDIEVLDEPAEEPLEEEDQNIEASKPSLKQRVTGSFQGISNQISQRVSGLKSKFTPGKEKAEEGEQEDEQNEGEFRTVKEGTTETVSELKEEERMEPLLSNNPFEPLETRNVILAQPLDSTEVVGGDLKGLTADEKPGFKVEESSEDVEEIEGKSSLFQKVKASISGTSSKISNQFNLTKEKVMSAFSHENKENIALLGLAKDIEDRSASQPEKNEK